MVMDDFSNRIRLDLLMMKRDRYIKINVLLDYIR